jgi:ferrochelatase
MLGEKGEAYSGDLPGLCGCLETLEEIAVQNREVFLEAGGQKYEYIPALNADRAHIEMMVNLTAPYR